MLWAESKERAFAVTEAELVGFDISGFSRFAEDWLARGDTSDVDDLARLWERAVAPQIDQLIEAGYKVADICGDGVVAYRPVPQDGREAAAVLRQVERSFAASAPGLSLRTARASGALVFAQAEAMGQHYAWTTGEAVEALHGLLRIGRRKASNT